jgi:hypothetical protein
MPFAWQVMVEGLMIALLQTQVMEVVSNSCLGPGDTLLPLLNKLDLELDIGISRYDHRLLNRCSPFQQSMPYRDPSLPLKPQAGNCQCCGAYNDVKDSNNAWRMVFGHWVCRPCYHANGRHDNITSYAELVAHRVTVSSGRIALLHPKPGDTLCEVCKDPPLDLAVFETNAACSATVYKRDETTRAILVETIKWTCRACFQTWYNGIKRADGHRSDLRAVNQLYDELLASPPPVVKQQVANTTVTASMNLVTKKRISKKLDSTVPKPKDSKCQLCDEVRELHRIAKHDQYGIPSSTEIIAHPKSIGWF